MYFNNILIFLLIIIIIEFIPLILLTYSNNQTINTNIINFHSIKRKKRQLIFPQGANFQLVYCLTIGSAGRKGDLVVGLTAALAWELPNEIDSKLTGLLHRHSRSLIYPKIEAFLHSIGLDGKSCVMKALCETGQRNKSDIGKNTFIHELIAAIFTLQKDGTIFNKKSQRQYDYVHNAKGNCTELFPSCKHSIFNLEI